MQIALPLGKYFALFLEAKIKKFAMKIIKIKKLIEILFGT